MWRIKRLLENLYFYIFRKTKLKDDSPRRASKLLLDSWNGRDSIIGSLIVKVNHLLFVNIKESPEESRYIDYWWVWQNKNYKVFQDLMTKNLSKLNHEDRLYFFMMSLKENDWSTRYHYFGQMDGNIMRVYEVKPVLNGTYDSIDFDDDGNIINVKNPRYDYPLGKENSKEIFNIPDFEWDFEHYDNAINLTKDYVSKNYDKVFEVTTGDAATFGGCFVISPQDFCKIAKFPELKKYIRGRIISYHNIWEYRRKLMSLYNFDPIELYNKGTYKREVDKKIDEANKIFKDCSESWWI